MAWSRNSCAALTQYRPVTIIMQVTSTGGTGAGTAGIRGAKPLLSRGPRRRTAVHERDPCHRRGANQGVRRSVRSAALPPRRREGEGQLFAGLAASGWHTAAITMRLLVESGLPLAGGIIGAGGEVSWPKPPRPGDVLRVVSEIEQVTPSRSRADRGTVRVHSETRNQRDEVVQVLIANIIVPRRATSQVAGELAAG